MLVTTEQIEELLKGAAEAFKPDPETMIGFLTRVRSGYGLVNGNHNCEMEDENSQESLADVEAYALWITDTYTNPLIAQSIHEAIHLAVGAAFIMGAKAQTEGRINWDTDKTCMTTPAGQSWEELDQRVQANIDRQIAEQEARRGPPNNPPGAIWFPFGNEGFQA